jgi:hypothetical protein
MDPSSIFLYVATGLVLLSVVTLVSSGSFLSVVVLLTLVAVIGYVLYKAGFLKISVSPSGGVDISLFEKNPAPAGPPATHFPIEKREVFYVSGNNYTYDEASAVCAAYDSDLATQDQVQEAYSSGAEWCGYGWTQGGMALYPTQQSTWQALQQEGPDKNRTACGRPGVNGGYFDPATKFGVNCYGVKPKGGPSKYPRPIPGTDANAFQNMVNKFKSMLKQMSVNPFNRVSWSQWNLSSHTNELLIGDTNSAPAPHS